VIPQASRRACAGSHTSYTRSHAMKGLLVTSTTRRSGSPADTPWRLLKRAAGPPPSDTACPAIAEVVDDVAAQVATQG